MEKQKTFKLFVPPRLSSSQVSAVKPQTLGGDSNLLKSFNKCIEDNFGFPFAMTKLSRNGENIDSDRALQKVNFLPMLEQVDNSDSCHYQEGLRESDCENSEPMSRLYSKLYKEAEKIKKWKVDVDSELKQKENKLQENRKIIEAQRKAIQELQFENEKVSLKLEEGIQENKDLIKENNSTRHLCNLLKETCAKSAEKTKKYEYEREETRQVYADLNNNIEKMIIAFEELRVKAENSRLEMHFKLKEDYEKIQHLEEDYKKEVNDKEKQVSLLLNQSAEKENKMKDLTFLLEESRDKVNQLEEKTKLQNENLKESNEKQDHLTSELEDTKMSLQRSVNTQKALEEDLQIATTKIYQLTGEKEAQMEEFNRAKSAHSLMVTEFKTTICNLKELLTTEQQRLEKLEDQLKILTMELQKKSSELEEMTKLKNNQEVELEELKKILAENQKLLDEKKHFEKIAEELKGTEQELTGLLQTREKKVHDLEIQLTAVGTSEQHYSKQVKELKTELENEKNELESVREELKQTGDEVKYKLHESEENARSIECEVLKKDKQMKVLENKCNNLKKQIENKSKCIEELQQENKALKKKGTAESKQLNLYEIKHQYDKIVEERDSELGLYKSKEQEQSSMKASLETELSNLKTELLSVKKQLEIERKEKEILKREAKETIVTLKEKEDKKTQTLETPETQYWKFDSKAALPQNVSQNFISADHGKSKDKRDYLQTSAKSTLSTPLPKVYTVKTPTKLKIQQRENKNTTIEESNKKRKMVFEFDINSDSSETTDLLSMVSEEETLTKLYKKNNPSTAHLCVRTPKKTPSSLTTPGSTLKSGAVRKMREDYWALVAKKDRKKKLKEAEKLFV
ncbi:synaptonemal complex protein 1 isoform X5 [Manis pentadactyla]|uniref:synaptonemal complex protein 1 isoform X5 n=1 Tax=Manis pentadactyla TaxID=143292 RepID=UPI00255C3BC7|nr:synaptonemal complex protein 1 isoform X5 [Manis pentadactyla]